jgi:anti-sigma B factor antagonist
MTFQTRFELNGNVVVIKIPKRLDLQISDDLKKLLSDFSKEGRFKYIMDLNDTEYVDSSGLSAFVFQIAACRSHSGDIHLVAPSESIKSLLTITHLDTVLKSFETIHSALNNFN